MFKITRILFPTDFSDASKTAEAAACAFAESFGAELHVLHVIQDVVLTAPTAVMTVAVPQSLLIEMRENIEAALQEIPPADWSKQHKVVRSARIGTSYVEICDYAKEQKIDLIVLSTHGRTGLKHLLLGSVAERVVQHAHCPVLSIRPS
jgi:nucleotide-binding universal stress UspA family protein